VVIANPRPLYARKRDPVNILQEAERALGQVWTVGKISSPPGFDPGIIQPVAGRHTAYTIYLLNKFISKTFFFAVYAKIYLIIHILF
jgi:hypothetical protein